MAYKEIITKNILKRRKISKLSFQEHELEEQTAPNNQNKDNTAQWRETKEIGNRKTIKETNEFQLWFLKTINKILNILIKK